jgi:hypothetical protein
MKNMKSLAALALLAATAVAQGEGDGWGDSGWGGESESTTYTTMTTDIFTTYCPSPTKVTMGTKTYTVTSAQTLTITECP